MNLFAKIFLGFWLSMVAIIVSWLLAGRYILLYDEGFPGFNAGSVAQRPAAEGPSPRPGAERSGQRPGMERPGVERPGMENPGGDRFTLPGPGFRDLGPGSHEIYRIFYGLQTVAADELLDWIRERENQDGLDIRLVDTDGEEIFNRKLIAGSEEVISRLSGFRRRTLHRENERMLFGQEFYRPEWGQLKLIIVPRPPASPLIAFLTRHLWLRLLIAVLISGAISYLVSRYLTRPLKHLQRASKDLASGNLAARIEVPERGGDETDALARDFNSMAAQLQDKITAQKRLLSDVSHELRSPLARMRVALALAEKDPQRGAEQLARIERETALLDELIGQLLSAPENPGSMEDILDLVSLLQEVCDDADFEARPDNKSVQFHSSLTEALQRSHGEQLRHAFENVIRNALRHTAAGSTVTVELAQREHCFEVVVEDCGPGAPEAALEKIFEPFYRVDEARQRETGGFGLGLSIARRAVEQHGGIIRAENRQQEGAERGLRVSIRLPAEFEAPVQAVAGQA
ncbi:MAG: ATP-binding protein [Halieaceae bacterium]|nr:ATP-binding protein [Halieaceae bacterium]